MSRCLQPSILLREKFTSICIENQEFDPDLSAHRKDERETIVRLIAITAKS